MGKAKKRIFNKTSVYKGSTLKRSEIISKVIEDVRSSSLTDETKNYITLFGITTEELSEAGAAFEEISAIKHLII